MRQRDEEFQDTACMIPKCMGLEVEHLELAYSVPFVLQEGDEIGLPSFTFLTR